MSSSSSAFKLQHSHRIYHIMWDTHRLLNFQWDKEPCRDWCVCVWVGFSRLVIEWERNLRRILGLWAREWGNLCPQLSIAVVLCSSAPLLAKLESLSSSSFVSIRICAPFAHIGVFVVTCWWATVQPPIRSDAQIGLRRERDSPSASRDTTN